MTSRDHVEFVTALEAMAEHFQSPMPPARIETYWMVLNDLDLETFKAACFSAMRTGKFYPFPTGADIREIVEGSPEDRGQRAWAQLQQAATSIGGYDSIRLEDPATAAALVRTFGSWVRFCTVELDPPMWANKRKEFLANYRIAQRQPADSSLLCLLGHAEIHNRETAALWGAGHDPMAQRRGLLTADGTVSSEPMVLDPSSGRLLQTHEAPQLTGTVEAQPGAVDVTQLLRDAAVQRVMKALIPATRGVCASCGATWQDEAHSPECELVKANAEHEARVRRQAMTLVASEREAS